MLARIILIPLILVLVAIGLYLGARNDELITLDYYFGQFEIRVAVALLLTLIVGICAGALAVYLGVVLKLKYRLRKARRESEKEMNLQRLSADS